MDGPIHDAAYIRFHRHVERRGWDNRKHERLAYTYCETQLETPYQHSCTSLHLPLLILH